jgi:16S rRNA pseudouridine516 synthase
MVGRRSRLDRFISKACQISLREVKVLLAQRQISVDGQWVSDAALQIDGFSTISAQGLVLQERQRVYRMLHKPMGVVSATQDSIHRTVLDLIDGPEIPGLHLAGRLDLNSSGLILLTNDGRWSKRLSAPETRVAKYYRVGVAHPITPDYIQAFAEGMYFEFEDSITAPVILTIVSDRVADLVLTEGKYHQIKRMFGRFRNPVLTLHRYRIGELYLNGGPNADPTEPCSNDLAEGQWRELTDAELGLFED